MLWEKINKKKKSLWVLFFIFVFLVSRLLNIGKDAINPDAVNWHYRSQQFVVGLKQGQFEKTYQHYHPGVVLMWVTGIPIEIYKQITNVQNYDQYNFLEFHQVAIGSLVLVQLALSLLIIKLLAEEVGLTKSVLVSLLFSLEPFFLGNSRLYHMDVLFSLFMLISLLYGYRFIKHTKYPDLILTSVFCSLSFLTKSIGIGLVPYIASMFFILFLKQKLPFKKLILYILIFLGVFGLVTFILFPALWVKPFYYIKEIFSEGERVGVRKGHEQIILGEVTNNAGTWFYPLVILMKFSPLILTGFFIYLFNFIKNFKYKIGVAYMHHLLKKISFPLFIGIFYLAYFLVMTYPSKKIDRYMIPLFPVFALYAVLGFLKVKKIVLYILAVLFIVIPLFTYFPYYFTYTSPVFISAENANKIVGQKPFGVGILEVKNYIVDNYDQENLGFYDTKPIKSIYSNSKIYDVRDYGPGSYGYLVLAVNEKVPEKVLESDYNFIKEHSIYINGLEYWRIYAKKSK